MRLVWVLRKYWNSLRIFLNDLVWCYKFNSSGDKSEVLDIVSPDLKRFPDFVKAKRYECVLEPGDLLFIPALWFHNTTALQFGVGVNVFWRHLPADSYDKKDPYGNKDPVAATRALQALERALHTLDELPADYRDFYGRRMIQRIQKRTYCDNQSSTTGQQDSWHFILQWIPPIPISVWRKVEWLIKQTCVALTLFTLIVTECAKVWLNLFLKLKQ